MYEFILEVMTQCTVWTYTTKMKNKQEKFQTKLNKNFATFVNWKYKTQENRLVH